MGYFSRAIENVVSKRYHPAKWPRNSKNLETWLITGDTRESSSYTGKDVNNETAMSVTAVYSAIMQMAQTIASLPLHLYVRKERGKDRAIKHKQYNMLHLKPNPFMTSMSFREQQAGQAMSYGFCCAEKEFDRSGNLIALWPLLSKNIDIKIDIDPLTDREEIFYTIKNLPDGSIKNLPSWKILKISGFSPDGLLGYNPISLMKESVGLSMAIEEHGARYFGSGARPSAVLEHPAQLSESAQTRLRKNWDKIHKGLENAHRIAILEEGMKLHQFQIDPEKSQTLETRKFQISEVARALNIPLHMLYELDRATYNNIETISQEFVIYCLRPWLVRFEQAYTIQLLSEKEQKKYFYEHLVDGLLRGDIKTRNEAYAQGRQWGWFSANDVREMENKNSIGPEGDIYLVPMNMIPADKTDDLVKGKENNFDDSQDPELKLTKNHVDTVYSARKRIHDSYIRLFEDAIKKILNREGNAVGRSLKKPYETYQEWLSDFFKDHLKYVRKIITPVVTTFSEQMFFQARSEILLDDDKIDIDGVIEETISNYAKNHLFESLDFFKNIYNSPHDKKTEINIYIENRVKQTAKSEIIRISNIVCNFVFKDNSYRTFFRTVAENPCEKCLSIDNKQYSKKINTCCCIVTI